MRDFTCGTVEEEYSEWAVVGEPTLTAGGLVRAGGRHGHAVQRKGWISTSWRPLEGKRVMIMIMMMMMTMMIKRLADNLPPQCPLVTNVQPDRKTAGQGRGGGSGIDQWAGGRGCAYHVIGHGIGAPALGPFC